MDAENRRAKWPWIVVLIVALVAMQLTFGVQVGRCVDYTANSRMVSFCESAPAAGWPAAIVIGVVGAALCILAIVRLARGGRRR